MAEAPLPGVEEHQEQVQAAKQILILKIRGEEYRLAINNVPISEKLIVRKATGLPLEAFISGDQLFGEDSVVILYWLARRGRGETFLTWTQAVEDWELLELDPSKSGEFEVVKDGGLGDEDDASLPESSGPA